MGQEVDIRCVITSQHLYEKVYASAADGEPVKLHKLQLASDRMSGAARSPYRRVWLTHGRVRRFRRRGKNAPRDA
jgi:hypothetical protein